jgi:hypothetical protein
MSTSNRIQVKIGPHEFSAEGPQETINAQFQKFLEAIALVSSAPALVAAVAASARPPQGQSVNEALSSNGTDGNSTVPMSPEHAKIFRKDRNGTVSLRTLPTGDSRVFDAVLLLIYGFEVVNQQQDVSAVQLMVAARQSGLIIFRFDRLLENQGQFVRRGGKKKGTRYTLTNPGRAHAEEVMRAMLG